VANAGDGPQERFSVELPVCIRACTEEDLPALEWDGLLAGDPGRGADALARQQRGEALLLVADVGGRPVGQALVDLGSKAAEGVGVVSGLRVLPGLRGAGIGTRLLAAAERVVVDRGLGIAEIEMDAGNEAGNRLCERLGYRAAGRVRATYFWSPPGGEREELTVDELLLQKPLESVATEPWIGAHQ
jgi:GNAT superfamily N-acetyltransferase